MKKFIQCVLILGLFSCASQKVVLDKGNYNYAVTAINTDVNGALLVKSFATGSNYEEVKANVLKKVVREVIFVGLTNGNKAVFQKPMVNDTQLETEKQDYFNNLYSSLRSATFVSIKTEFAKPEEIKALSKTQNLALGFEVSVNLPRLKEKLINDGIIKN